MGIFSNFVRDVFGAGDKAERNLKARKRRREKAEDKKAERRAKKKARPQVTCTCGCWWFPHRKGSCAKGCAKADAAQVKFWADKEPDTPRGRWARKRLAQADRETMARASSRALERRRRTVGRRARAAPSEVPF